MTKYTYHPTKKEFQRIPEYIYERQNGWFEIRKRVGGMLLYWGSYPTLAEAKLHKAYYIGKNWQVNPTFKANRHIIKRNGHYTILKKTDEGVVSFGTFKTLEEARHERDICEACQWDYDLIVEYED